MFKKSFASLKKQVMIDGVVNRTTHTRCLIGVETPTLPLPFLDYFANIVMMPN